MPTIRKHIYLLLLMFPFSLFSQSLSVLDSLKALLPSLEEASKVEVQLKICNELKFQDAEAAREYCQEALELSKQLSLQKMEGIALQRIGVTYEGQGTYDLALEYANQALEVFLLLNDSLELANTYNNIGIVFDQKGENEKALQRLFRALRLYEALEDDGGIAQAANNIGIVYKKEKNYPKVIEYYKRSLAIYEKIEHGFGAAATKSNIGSVYLDMKEYESSIQYSQEALTEFESLGIRQYLPYVLENLGLANKNLGRFELAKDFHQKALKLYQEYDNKKEMAFTLNSLADIFIKTNQFAKAKPLALESLSIAEEVGVKEEQRNAHLTLSKIYEIKANYKKALFHQQQFSSIKDTLFEIEKTERIAELNTRYDTEKKEKENLRLKSQTDIQALTISKKQNQLIGLGVGALLLLLIGGLLWNRMRLKQTASLAQKQLEFQEQATQLTIQTQEEERNRISKDLHDGIGQQLSGLKMAWSQLTSQIEQISPGNAGKLKKLTEVLDDAANDVRNISHQMMPRALEEFGLVSALDDMLVKSFKTTNVKYEFEHFGLKGRFPQKIEIGLYRIAQELINNTIKHAKSTEVGVQLFQNKQSLVLVIEDNGAGFQVNQEKTGHGLTNIKFRTKAIGGIVNWETSPGEGTIATIRVPLVKH